MIIINGNYIRVDTDFILKDNFRQFRHQLFLSRHTARTICLIRIAHSSVRQFKEDFVFALMKCSYAAFGEQNKTDNDSKCQQVYKSLIIYILRCTSQQVPNSFYLYPYIHSFAKKLRLFFCFFSILYNFCYIFSRFFSGQQ